MVIREKKAHWESVRTERFAGVGRILVVRVPKIADRRMNGRSGFIILLSIQSIHLHFLNFLPLGIWMVSRYLTMDPRCVTVVQELIETSCG